MDLMPMLRSYKAQAEVLMPSCETLMLTVKPSC